MDAYSQSAGSLGWEIDPNLWRRLDSLPAKARNKLGAKALRQIGRDGVKAMKAAIKHDVTGALKRSIGYTVKTKRRDQPLLIVGPRKITGKVKGEKKQAGWHKRLSARNAKAAKRTPTRYAHLVEKGHGGKTAKPAPFIAPIIPRLKSEAKRAIRDALREAVAES